MSISTPWGRADFEREIAPGIIAVSTPGHGGVGVNYGTAVRKLSQKARDAAIREHGHYWFEEDCDWAIAAHEIDEVQAYFNVSTETVMDTLIRWNPEYLGIEHDEATLDGNEGFLRTAWGDWHDNVPPGHVGIRAEVSDGRINEGIVPRSAYDNMVVRGEHTKAQKVISLEDFEFRKIA